MIWTQDSKFQTFIYIILWRVAELSESCDPSKYSPLGCARFDVSLFCQDDGMFASFFMDCYGLHFYLGLGNRNLAYIELPWDKKKLMTHLLLLLLRSYSTLVQTVLLNLRITWYDCWGGEGDHEGPAIGMPTKSSLYSSLLTHSAGAYPGFHSRSVITSPSMGCYQAFLTVSQYPCILLWE